MTMPTISDFKGFSYPSPTGVSSIVGNMPWHFATEHLCISYESNPEAVATVSYTHLTLPTILLV